MTHAKRVWVHDLLLVVVLLAATYFRVIGMNWDANQHLHPDERFLTMVETALQVKKCTNPNMPLQACPPDQIRWLGFGDYLNTADSTLNPQNQGYGFFVYGDFPIVVVRYIAEWVTQTGYDQVQLVGRQVSALSDLLTIVLIYLIAARLYDRRVALLAAAFSALAVLQIQQSHFFTVDTVANLFIFLALYCAIQILLRPSASEAQRLSAGDRLMAILRDPFLLLSLGFGVSLGLAVASKLNAAPLAILLPGAYATRYFLVDRRRIDPAEESASTLYWSRVALYLVAGGAAALLTFRLAQPYAFQGLGLNPAWLDNIRSLEAQSNGNADVPFALQWARRSHFFSFGNLTVWGLGLPLGILAWAGFLVMAWRILKGELRHALLWVWTAAYFGWQSLAFNPTMRYQLPVYPLLCMMAGWLLIFLWDQSTRMRAKRLARLLSLSSLSMGLVALALSAAWAYAFTRIYTRPVTRVAATEWIYQNVPGPVNLRIQTPDGSEYQQPLPISTGGVIAGGRPSVQVFSANTSGELRSVYLPHVLGTATTSAQTLRLSIGLQPDASSPEQVLSEASLSSTFVAGNDPRGTGYTVNFDQPATLLEGQTYYIHLETDGALSLIGAAPINESDWDDGLPLRYAGYDAYGGLYQGDLNLQIYWDDNAEKLQRFVQTLNQGDFIFMSSNRQWATVTRVPERYPLTTAYYRDLIGCPADKDVIWCYNVARPGVFEGQLGYKLVAVFESFPTIEIPGVIKWEANDQFAEEAFTVYDHPKVLIFQKRADLDRKSVV